MESRQGRCIEYQVEVRSLCEKDVVDRKAMRRRRFYEAGTRRGACGELTATNARGDLVEVLDVAHILVNEALSLNLDLGAFCALLYHFC